MIGEEAPQVAALQVITGEGRDAGV